MKPYFKLCSFTIIIFLLFYSCQTEKETKRIDVIHKHLESVADIVDIDSSLVIPYDYVNVVSLDNLGIEEKKKKFIDLLLPAILVAKVHISDHLERVEALSKKDSSLLSRAEKKYLENLRVKYEATSTEQLIRKLYPPPNSIVLAQAALESGWGTSRFFREANNIFGIWSFNKNEPRVKARILRGDKAIYVKKYAFLSESVEDYFMTIARGPYRDFRIENKKNENPYKLIPLLKRYSENDSIYNIRLRHVIHFNDLGKYDDYQINPAYLND